MNDREARETYVCPTCKAEPPMECVTGNGNPIKTVHQARYSGTKMSAQNVLRPR